MGSPRTATKSSSGSPQLEKARAQLSFSLCVLRTSSLGITWELVRNSVSQAPPQPFWITCIHRMSRWCGCPSKFEKPRSTVLLWISLALPGKTSCCSTLPFPRKPPSPEGKHSVNRRDAKPPGPALSDCEGLPPLEVLPPSAEKGKFCWTAQGHANL